MARPVLATIEELEARLGSTLDTGGERTQADARLADASEIVRAYAGVTWLNDDETALADDVPGQIVGVVASMVERASRNPGGVTQETAGPFGRSFGADAAARLYMTKSERMVVRAAVGKTGLGTIATSRGPLETGRTCDRYGIGDTPEEDYVPLTNLMGGT